jgi:hypothetical protein
MTAFVHYYWRLPQSKLTSLSWLLSLRDSFLHSACQLSYQVCWPSLPAKSAGQVDCPWYQLSGQVYRVDTYVQRGLSFALLLLFLMLLFLLGRHYSKYCISVQFHHAFSIFAPLHCMNLARQPCLAALPGSLARQAYPAGAQCVLEVIPVNKGSLTKTVRTYTTSFKTSPLDGAGWYNW